MRSIKNGFSLIETIVSVAILGVLATAMFGLIAVSTEAAKTSINLISKDVDLDRNLQKIVKEVRNAVLGTITLPLLNTVATNRIVFKKQVNFIPPTAPGENPTFITSEEIVIRLAQEDGGPSQAGGGSSFDILGNGLDDDGDGFIDEGIVVLEIGGVRKAVLITEVSQLNFTLNPNPSITISIEKQVKDTTGGSKTGNSFIRIINATRTIYIANNQPI